MYFRDLDRIELGEESALLVQAVELERLFPFRKSKVYKNYRESRKIEIAVLPLAYYPS